MFHLKCDKMFKIFIIFDEFEINRLNNEEMLIYNEIKVELKKKGFWYLK